mmetsp:Transcript_26514/g.31276  ORF Transcript_26514/g.31276 Transcript_26514/m.31276 type:complete len:98 (+) Transcript_26514:314-607(+)
MDPTPLNVEGGSSANCFNILVVALAIVTAAQILMRSMHGNRGPMRTLLSYVSGYKQNGVSSSLRDSGKASENDASCLESGGNPLSWFQVPKLDLLRR